MKPDFAQIRAAVKAIVEYNGGKVEVREWNASDGDTMKVVMTFKNEKKSLSSVNLQASAALR